MPGPPPEAMFWSLMTTTPQDQPAADAQPTDAEARIIQGLREGDNAAMEDLLQLLGPRLLATARRITGDDHDARDAFQDGILSAWKNIDSFQGDSKLSTWLHRIVVNAALAKLRKNKRAPRTSLDGLLPTFDDSGHRVLGQAVGPKVSDQLEREELQAVVRQKIDELPDDYRNVVLLRDIEQLDTKQTADYLGIKEGAVKTRLHRARQALRSLLEGEVNL